MSLLPAEIVQTQASPEASVIWLHGLGADGHDFVPVVPQLTLPPDVGIRFVFPHAPVKPVTINNGYVMPPGMTCSAWICGKFKTGTVLCNPNSSCSN